MNWLYWCMRQRFMFNYDERISACENAQKKHLIPRFNPRPSQGFAWYGENKICYNPRWMIKCNQSSNFFVDVCVRNTRWSLPGAKQGARGAQFPGRRMTARGTKSPNNFISAFLNTVYLLPKNLRFEHGGANLASCPRRHLTSLHPEVW